MAPAARNAAAGGIASVRTAESPCRDRPATREVVQRSMKKPSLEPLFPMHPAISDIEQVVRAGAQFKDMPSEPWPERGYAVTGWNGAADGGPSTAFTLWIGAVDEKLAAFNRFEITLSDAPRSASLVSAANVERVVAATRDTFVFPRRRDQTSLHFDNHQGMHFGSGIASAISFTRWRQVAASDRHLFSMASSSSCWCRNSSEIADSLSKIPCFR